MKPLSNEDSKRCLKDGAIMVMAKVCYIGSDFKLDMSRRLRMRGCSGNTTPLAFDMVDRQPMARKGASGCSSDLQEWNHDTAEVAPELLEPVALSFNDSVPVLGPKAFG